MNSTCSKYCNLSGLLVQFLDQLAKLGETAGKLKNFEKQAVDKRGRFELPTF